MRPTRPINQTGRAGRWLGLSVAFLWAVSWSGAARAEPVFTGRVSLAGMVYAESNLFDASVKDTSDQAKQALGTSALLAYGEVRGLFEGKRLWRDRLDLRLDFRLRLTGSFNYERKFIREGDITDLYAMNPGVSLGVSARGYLGGSEYDLREAYGLLRATDTLTLQVGRMFVREADAIKLDGVRLLQRFGQHWEGGVLLGGYPNPYSRSVLSDYQALCGAGVAAAREQTIQEAAELDPNGQAPCVSSGPLLSLGAGVTARYNYTTLWGSIGLVGLAFGGQGDGGPAVPLDKPDPAKLDTLQPPEDRLDAPRIFLSWNNSFRPIERLDLFTDLVFDAYGSAGPQLTRLVGLGTLRLLKDDRLVLRLGYSHLSSLAINMFLNRQLYNRRSGVTLSLSGFSAYENNLTVLRTARDEVRATADFKLGRRLGLYADGRFRYRALMGGEAPGASQLAGDGTVGVRDSGSLREIRAGLAYTALFTFRGQNHLVTLDVGRDFFGERLGVDLQYVFVYTKDAGIGMPGDACNGDRPFDPVCYGWRQGMTHELGLTVTGNPVGKLFLLLDYRLIALQTDPQPRSDPTAPEQVPLVLSNAALLRGEYRW